MKIIFLDIDGVLNSIETFNKKIKDHEIMNTYLDSMVDEDLVLNLQTIVDKTNAKIVLSSTWRFSHYDYLIKKLGVYGIEIIGKTPDFNYPSSVRGNEILQWIKDNKELVEGEYYGFKSYVILDDSSDMLYWQKDNFVEIDSKIGLSNDNVVSAIKILGEK